MQKIGDNRETAVEWAEKRMNKGEACPNWCVFVQCSSSSVLFIELLSVECNIYKPISIGNIGNNNINRHINRCH